MRIKLKLAEILTRLVQTQVGLVCRTFEKYLLSVQWLFFVAVGFGYFFEILFEPAAQSVG